MDAYVTSMDNPQKILGINGGHGSQASDVHMHTPGMSFTSLHLTAAGIGTGNYHYTCPLYKAGLDVTWLFVENKDQVLNTKGVYGDFFKPDHDSMITFATPEWYPGMAVRMDFIRSQKEFFGIRGRVGREAPTHEDDENIIWLCGPDNKEYASLFGKRAYRKRRLLFAEIYDRANADPIQMSNPIFPGEHGMKEITKGRQPC